MKFFKGVVVVRRLPLPLVRDRGFGWRFSVSRPSLFRISCSISPMMPFESFCLRPQRGRATRIRPVLRASFIWSAFWGVTIFSAVAKGRPVRSMPTTKSPSSAVFRGRPCLMRPLRKRLNRYD